MNLIRLNDFITAFYIRAILDLEDSPPVNSFTRFSKKGVH
jgi:hypothetical protein